MPRLRGLAVAATVLPAACGTIPPLQMNSLPNASPLRRSATFDHSGLDRLLQRYVDDDGLVDYHGLAGDQRELAAYLESLAAADLDHLATDDERKAYWINAYNAITLAGILQHYPTRSIRDLPGFWQRLTTNCGGHLISLEQIEHQVLRSLGDPRIHMAINCASMSCPKLANRAYTGAGVDQQLDEAARVFLASPQRNRFATSAPRASLSMIFSWFGGDFATAPYGGVRGFVRYYGPALPWLTTEFSIDYLPYDWSLNEQPTGRP